MNLNLPESPVYWVKEQCHFVQWLRAMDEAPWAIWEAENRAQRAGAPFLLCLSHCRVQCLSNRSRAWHGTNYTPIYLEGVAMTPRPKAKLETLKSRTTEKHNLNLSPSVQWQITNIGSHLCGQSACLGQQPFLGEGISRDRYVLSCLGAFKMRVYDSPTA